MPAGFALAAPGINKQIPYQGVLQDSTGANVSDGNYNIIFRIYDASTSGTTLWTGTHTTANGNAVSLSSGLFRVLLGSGTGNTMTLDFTGDTYWLGVTVGSDSEMTPRQRIGATAQAFTSDHVFGTGQSVVGTTTPFSTAELTVEATTTSATPLVIRGFASQVADLFRIITDTGTQLLTFTSGGRLGIGTTTPSATFSVSGDSYFTATSTFSEGILISSSTPDVTSNALYNNAGVLYWSGNIVKTAEENWTFATNYGVTNLTASSTMPWWSQGAFYASSTVQIAGHSAFTTASSTDQSLSGYLVVSGQTTLGNASTTQLTNSGLSWFTGLTTLGNASSTRLSVSDKSWFTNLATFGNASTTQFSVSGTSWFTGLSTLGNASSTLLTNTGQSWFNSTSTFATDARFDTNTLVVDSFNNRVGIGTTSPATPLEIMGDFRVAEGINYNALFVDATQGQVGIGTDSPNEKLHIYGDDNYLISKIEQIGSGEASLRFYAPDNSTSDEYITFYSGLISTDWSFGTDASDSHKLKISTTFDDPGSGTVLTLQQDGKIGIGTISPAVSLDVTGGIRARGGIPGAGGVNNNGYAFDSSGDTDSGMFSTSDGLLQFYTNNNERMRINSSGYVSIGTTTSISNLLIEVPEYISNDTDNQQVIISNNTDTNSGLRFGFNGSTMKGYINVLNPGFGWGDLILGAGSGKVGISNVSPAVSLDVTGGIRARGGTPGAGGVNNNGYTFDSAGDTDSGMFSTGDGILEFLTNNVKKVDIDSVGHFNSIGTESAGFQTVFRNDSTNDYASGIYIRTGPNINPGSNTKFVGFVDGDNTMIATISGDGAGGVVYNTTSDRRAKENIRDTHYTLEDLLKIKVRDFNMKTSDIDTIGFIAQELYEIYPEAVSAKLESDELWGVDYGRITPLLVKSIQDQQEQIEVLQGQVNSLTLVGTVEEFVTDQESDGTLVVGRIIAKEELCIGDTGGEVCLNKKELTELKTLLSGTTPGGTDSSDANNTSLISPTITILGNNPAEIEVGFIYSDLGAVITDDKGNNLGLYASVDDVDVGDFSNIQIDTSEVGTYTIIYRTTDNDGNTTTAERQVVVYDPYTEADDSSENGGGVASSTSSNNIPVDITSPVITLNAENAFELNVGDSYTEEGVVATDDVDGDITTNIIIGGDSVLTDTEGVYTITYNVSDAAGNQATEVTRAVTVLTMKDTTSPIITLIGKEEIILVVDETYFDEGATALDDTDGDVTSSVTVENTVDTATAGVYTVIYNVSDIAGNIANKVTRTVTVEASAETSTE